MPECLIAGRGESLSANAAGRVRVDHLGRDSERDEPVLVRREVGYRLP